MTSPSTQRATSQVCAIRLRRQFFGGCWQNYFNCTLSVFFVFIIDDINLHVMCNKKKYYKRYTRNQKKYFQFRRKFLFHVHRQPSNSKQIFFLLLQGFSHALCYCFSRYYTAAVPFTAKNYCLNLPPDYLTLE